MRTLSRAFPALLVFSALAFSQSTAPEQPLRTQKDLDTFLSKPLSDRDLLGARTYELKACTAENAGLRQQLDDRHQQEGIALAAFFGLGFGLAAAVLGLKHIIHLWSLSVLGKQFVAMLAAATWVSTVVFLQASDKALSSRPISVALSVFVYSLPAILFSGIAVWWLRRQPATEALRSQINPS